MTGKSGFFSDDSPILEAMRMVVDFLKLRLGWRFFLILPRSDIPQLKNGFRKFLSDFFPRGHKHRRNTFFRMIPWKEIRLPQVEEAQADLR